MRSSAQKQRNIDDPLRTVETRGVSHTILTIVGHVPTLLRQLADKLGLAIISRMRRQAEAALLQREALMHALAVSASELSHRLQPG